MMTTLRTTILTVFALATLSAAVAATTPHRWSKGFDAAAAAAATEGGVCYLALLPSRDAAGNLIDEQGKHICP